MNHAQHRYEVSHDSRSLAGVDRQLRAAEASRYSEQPSLKMPIMLPVHQLGAKVLWPSKFK